MKILTDNKLRGANISSSNGEPNYPAQNLIDDFLHLRYQANADTDEISIKLSEPASFDCFYIGYTGNISSITIHFYSDGGVENIILLYQASTGDGNLRIFEDGVNKFWAEGAIDYWNDYFGAQFASRSFTKINDIDEIKISIIGTSPIYIGGVAGGALVDMPPAVAAWRDDYTDNSIVTRSAYGQVQQNYIEPYKVFGFTFEEVSFTKFYEIKTSLRSLGAGGGAWVTFFEDSEDEFPPGYYTISFNDPERNKNVYSFNLTFTEAR